MLHIKKFLACAAALACAAPQFALAKDWPTKPITVIVSSGPGAGVDSFARMLMGRVQTRLGQTIIIENRAGAAGMIAARGATRAAPDGYTFLLGPNTLAIAPHVMAADASIVRVMTELAPVSMPSYTSMVLAVNGKFADANQINTVQDLTAYIKKHPGFAYSGGNIGSPMHVMGAQFQKESGLDLITVPYSGVAKMVTALLGGDELKMAWMPVSGQLQYFRDGTLRVLSTSSPTRSLQVPKAPTMAELGYRDVKAIAWNGIWAPLGTPAAIIARMNQEINAVLKEPDFRAKLEQSGDEAAGGTPDVLTRQIAEDDERYHRLAADLNIRTN